MRIAVYGLGRLGYPLFNVLARAGHEVVGIDPARKGVTYVGPWAAREPGLEWADVLVKNVLVSAIPQPADMSFIVVPTPSLNSGDHRGGFDSGHVEDALRGITNVNGPGHVAVIVSTVSPGTCERLARTFPTLSLVYNPTFIALGDVVSGLTKPNLLLIGRDNTTVDRPVLDVWEQVFAAFGNGWSRYGVGRHFASYTEIELIKLSVNAALATKISLANSLGELFSAWGVDPRAVEVVGRDPRIGEALMRPGGPISGPCLPRDNAALNFAAAQMSVALPIALATDRVNHTVKFDLLTKIVDLKPASVGILGMSYKHGVDLDTESVGRYLSQRLGSMGIAVETFDDLLGGDLEKTLDSEVIVVTQVEYQSIIDNVEPVGTVVKVWP